MASATSETRGGSMITGGHSRQKHVNVSDTERWLSAIGGGALAVYGLSRGSLGGLALAAFGGVLVQRGLSGHCMGYQALGINTADRHGPASSVAAGHGVKVERSITVLVPRERLYQFWRNVENLPRIMKHLKSVTSTGNKTSRWVAQGPLNTSFEWDAEIINEKENELIAWKSLEGSTVDTAGSVHFTPAPGVGTVVKVTLKYDPPAGKVGSFIARLFHRAPEQEIVDDLKRFKSFMESGEVPTAGKQPAFAG
jgi:uncharacterized membrane protein